MQADLHRVRRHTQHRRDLARRNILDVAQDENRPVVIRQPADALAHGCARLFAFEQRVGGQVALGESLRVVPVFEEGRQ